MTPARIKELRHYILRAQIFPLQLVECLDEIERLQAALMEICTETYDDPEDDFKRKTRIIPGIEASLFDYRNALRTAKDALGIAEDE